MVRSLAVDRVFVLVDEITAECCLSRVEEPCHKLLQTRLQEHS